MTWFETLFGFAEAGYEETRDRFAVEGSRLRSLLNDRTFGIGDFSRPSLVELRRRGSAAARTGELRITHEIVGDILGVHAAPENRGDLFQVASRRARHVDLDVRIAHYRQVAPEWVQAIDEARREPWRPGLT